MAIKEFKSFNFGNGDTYVPAPTKWADIPDKPFVVSGGDTLTWDGNTSGLVSDDSGMFYKVSDVTPSIGDFSNGGSVTFDMGGVVDSATFDSTGVIEMGTNVYGHMEGTFIVALEDNVSDGYGVYPEKGIYFIVNPNVPLTVTSLTIPGYTGFITEKLDPKVLPDGINKQTVFYCGFFEQTYLYSDQALSTKVTVDQFVEAAVSGTISIHLVYEAVGVVVGISPPVCFTWADEYASVIVVSSAENGVANCITLYTAEYTG